MNRPNEGFSVVLGALTAAGIGNIFFQALGAVLLGLLGALGGYLFGKFIKPKLDALISKKKDKEA